MNYKLAKCARCNKLFTKGLSEVCAECQPREDQDFSRIRDVLASTGDLTAQEVAEQAGVSMECVTRMLREGRLDNVEEEVNATCGRCGAPAISNAKRLCRKCLADLDRECAQAMHEMRARLHAKDSTDMNDVMDAVEKRRASLREKRKERDAAPAPTEKPGRMIIPDHLRRGSDKKP